MSTDAPNPDDTPTDEPDQNRPDDEADHALAVADPKQYNQNQRLKEIHEARRAVQKAYRESGKADTQIEYHENNRTVAFAVVGYGYELRPLIRKADIEVPKLPDDWTAVDDLDDYLEHGGLISKDDQGNKQAPSVQFSMRVFGILNETLNDLGLEAQLDAGLDEDLL